jgi:MinD superfamily P-loop ATPase
MILNKKFYGKVSLTKKWWIKKQLARYSGERLFKVFKLHKVEWPGKPYFYSPRLKSIPRFIGTKKELSNWKDAYLCETICPTKAIKVTEDSFIIDERGCISCQLCVEFAPEGLFELSVLPGNTGT